MSEFFRGWKRKIGVVTLAMALVFAAGWARSFTVIDILSTSGDASESVVSAPHILAWWSARYGNGARAVSGWESHSSMIWRVRAHPHDDHRITWIWRRFGFGYVETVFPDFRMTYRYIPYWSIVTPLMLLSAWLLLSTPRNPTAVPSDEVV